LLLLRRRDRLGTWRSISAIHIGSTSSW